MMHIIYSSEPTQAADPILSSAKEILRVSRANNALADLSGFLLFSKRWFIQILEGESRAVQHVFHKIEADPRHTNIRIIAERSIVRPTFPIWSMGAAVFNSETEEIFLRHGLSDGARAIKLAWPSILSLAMDLQDRARANDASHLA